MEKTFRTEDEIRDRAQLILGFDKNEIGVQQGTGQITTFNQLGFKECEEKLCEKDWFFCGVAGTPLSMMKSRKQMSEYLDKMLAKREKVVIAAESGRKIAALAAMYASERGYSFIPVANDDLSTYLAKQQQKGCVMFDGAENEREIENTCRELRIPLRRCKLEGA